MMRWHGGGMAWGGWLGMGLFWLLVLGLIAFLAVRLLPRPSGGGRAFARGPRGESPEETLDRRFAQGDIDMETYQMQRSALARTRGQR